MIYFDGKGLEAVAPLKVDDVAVSSVRLSVNARQRPVRYGSDFVRVTGASRTVTITFALLTNDRTNRQRQIMQIAAWADVGKIHKLTLPEFPNMYLECACTEVPSPSVKQWWEGKLRLIFTTYENPYFTDIYEKSASCGNTAFFVNGDAPDGPLMRIEKTLGASDAPVYSDGTNSMTFGTYTNRPTGTLVVDLNNQTADVGGTSVMQGYTYSSKFIIPKTGNMTISGSGTVYWRERWL